ncbi:unnamed protein product [Colias eurytheme]|nr:unnamed protein product [Colias eurytheme]
MAINSGAILGIADGSWRESADRVCAVRKSAGEGVRGGLSAAALRGARLPPGLPSRRSHPRHACSEPRAGTCHANAPAVTEHPLHNPCEAPKRTRLTPKL